MNEAIKQMLKKYDCKSEQDYINALKEIFQEIALLGLWRAKFFEKAAFYGGSALRILYQLDRFSEDLDFTLLHPENNFDLSYYNKFIADELLSFGFKTEVVKKNKNIDSNIESAFIKADTKTQLLRIAAPIDHILKTHRMQTIKIKMEVDINPPLKFSTEVKSLLQPIPFLVKSMTLPNLFAGKIHAILCRPWQKRVKGRDWYDFIWYLTQSVPVNLIHLTERLKQTRAWDKKNLTKDDLMNLLTQKIKKTDFGQAKLDIIPFIKDPAQVSLWSEDFFLSLLDHLLVESS